MLRRFRMAVRLPLMLATIFLLCLAMHAPATAAQNDQATPIGVDDNVHSLAEPVVAFTASQFFAFPGTAYAPVYFDISSGDVDSLYPFKVWWGDSLPAGITFATSDSVPVPPVCPTQPAVGGLAGTYDTIGMVQACQVTVYFSVDTSVPIGTSFSISVELPYGTTQSTATFTVTAPTFAFDQTTYTGKVGNPIAGQFVTTTPAGFPTLSLTVLGTPYTSLPLTYVSSQGNGNTTCDVDHDEYFIYITADATGAGTCAVAFTVGTNSGPTTDPSIEVWANYAGSVSGTIASQIVIEAPTLTAGFDAATYSAKPGGETTASLTMTTDAAISTNPYQVLNPMPGVLEFVDPTITGSSGIDCGTPELSNGNIQGTLTAAGGSSQIESCTLSFTIQVAISAETQQPGDFEIGASFAGVAPDPSATFSILAPEAATAMFDQPSYSAAPGASTTANLTLTFPEVQFGGTVIIRNTAPDVFTFDNTSVTSETGGVTCDLDNPGLDNFAYVHAVDGPGSCIITFDIIGDRMASNGSDGDIEVVLQFQNNDPAAVVTFTVDDPLNIGEYSFHIRPETGFAGDLGTAVLGGNPPYTFTLVTGPTHGSLEFNEDGTFLYIANRDATGTDSFTYTVADANGVDVTSAAQGQGTVTIIFDAAPSSPTPTATTVAPTATQKPILPGRTPTPTPTATEMSGTGGSTGSAVTRLPSTGTANESPSSGISLWVLLVMGVLLLIAATLTSRRKMS